MESFAPFPGDQMGNTADQLLFLFCRKFKFNGNPFLHLTNDTCRNEADVINFQRHFRPVGQSHLHLKACAACRYVKDSRGRISCKVVNTAFTRHRYAAMGATVFFLTF